MYVTGEVVPLGGLRTGQHGECPIILGDRFTEPLSKKTVRIQGGYLTEAEVLPSHGGNGALLDANVLAIEARILDTLGAYKEAVTGMCCHLVVNFITISDTWWRIF